jgi:hypothetical protein
MHGDNRPIDPATAEIPASTGIPIGVRFALFMGVFIVVFIMCLTAGSSIVGHYWPWSTAMQATL